MLGVAAAHAPSIGIVITGLAGLVAGALSMGAGEYVSVSSQADTERADLEIERRALKQDFAAERAELRDIYVRRGLDHNLAAQVSEQLRAHDALGAHARDDIGITDALMARPIQAAIASSISFAVGSIVPLLAGVLEPRLGSDHQHRVGARSGCFGDQGGIRRGQAWARRFHQGSRARDRPVVDHVRRDLSWLGADAIGREADRRPGRSRRHSY